MMMNLWALGEYGHAAGVALPIVTNFIAYPDTSLKWAAGWPRRAPPRCTVSLNHYPKPIHCLIRKNFCLPEIGMVASYGVISFIVAPESAPQTPTPVLGGVEHPLAPEVVNALQKHRAGRSDSGTLSIILPTPAALLPALIEDAGVSGTWVRSASLSGRRSCISTLG
jgi:hypothetical protein